MKDMITNATTELNHEIELGRQRGTYKRSWRIMRRFFNNEANNCTSGVLNFAAAWFMQGKEVSDQLE